MARGGDDTLFGSGTLTGGAGADSYVFQATGTGSVIADFATGTDTIHLDASWQMRALDLSGRFSAGDARFYAAAGTNAGHDADDRVVYNTSTGQLYFDRDGSGSDAAELIGTLQGAPLLGATDIVVDNGTAPGAAISGTAGDDSLAARRTTTPFWAGRQRYAAGEAASTASTAGRATIPSSAAKTRLPPGR
jgi:hypothetical protein